MTEPKKPAPGLKSGPKSDPGSDITPPIHKPPRPPKEIGGPKGPEPTRYGDWEVGGIVSDF